MHRYAGGAHANISAEDWPVLVADGVVVRVSISYHQSSTGSSLSLKVSGFDVIPLVYVRLFNGLSAEKSELWTWKHAANVTQWHVTSGL